MLFLDLYVPMDGLYLPNGRHLALIDRDWILDKLPHLGNPDDNSDVNYLVASVAAATSGSADRSTTGNGTGGSSSHGIQTNTGGADSGNSGANQNHTLSHNPNEFEGDLTLLSEIVDETQNKWSDLGLNQLLTSYARFTRRTFK
jgi:hypothetical protein